VEGFTKAMAIEARAEVALAHLSDSSLDFVGRKLEG
jgi:hypothetical protein